jgi:hypothetical protein
MCRVTNLAALVLYLTTLAFSWFETHVTAVDLRILRSSRGSTVSPAERACAVLLPTASVCKMSTGIARMGTIVCEFMGNGSSCLTTPL